MLTADANSFKRFIKDNLNVKSNILGKAIKKYCDIFWDLEKRYKKFSQKELDRVISLINEELIRLSQAKIKSVDELKMLATYFAKKQIYLHLKNK